MGVRRNFLSLTGDQRQRFVSALKKLKKDGVIDRFADLHNKHFNMSIHKSSHFLPWHREMLRRFENELHRYEPGLDLPYWDSSVERSTTGSLWSQDFMGQFDALWGLNRALGANATLPSQSTVNNNRGRGGYDALWPELEFVIHDPPHVWVGGRMNAPDSPHDPVFYLHHAWIDLLWALWQEAHPNAPFVASADGTGLNDPLMEWSDRTPANVIDHHVLGYAYDVEPVPTGKPVTGNDMLSDEALTPGAAITSTNGRYRFLYQSDGNLVLYAPWGPLWASNTAGKAVGVCLMQSDGNLVIYGPGGLYVWDSATDGNPGARLIAQDDGNVVIYRTNNTTAWETGTWLPVGPTPGADTMTAGQVLLPGQGIRSTNGRYQLTYQGDGNLVLYGPAGAMWASNTADSRPGACIMQGDGNLVIYAPGGQYIWDSATDGNPGARLIAQNDGNVVIYRTNNTPAWDTGTWQP
ncbi:tyrosinase family protein [Actinomadura nitritigenes]|uniref:tyrosinase family protein n=1 Tax=Actinomadura nitritigenes TaxID=134602 RepID=UPI003D8DE661